MPCCAIEGCDDVNCPVCSVPRRFAHVPRSLRDAEGLKESAPALNGTKPKPSKRGSSSARRVGPHR